MATDPIPCTILDVSPIPRAHRQRSAGVPASPLHVTGRAELDRPTVTRLAEAAALLPSHPDPLLSEAVTIVAEMLAGDGPARLHKARDIVQALTPVFEQAEARGANGRAGRDLSATAVVAQVASEAGADAATSSWFAAIAIGALARAGHLR